MNKPAPVGEFADVNMTSKGQVLIPKTIRDRVGLVPGAQVAVGINDRGEAVVLPKRIAETPEERRSRIRAALEAARGSMRTGFPTTDEYMDFIRPHRRDPL
ncbi:MAG: antitoxin PrlF [Sphingomonadales bacterium]|jgi:AbrB family looped-hinge helix DNA binding protein|nr:antitoxin PrlF [Sphingomonadales bacterium]